MTTIQPMTKQEVFTTVVTHLRKQGCRSIDSAGVCKYRGNKGMACAVGCLISDAEYEPSMERENITAVLRLYPNLHARLASSVELLIDLQHIHDACDVVDWENHFRTVAKTYSLQVPA